ncbi:MAG: archease [Archaeoglobaceae archaeon]|nr:archease [Archaeoglobaceae archaeon]MDW8014231.1 archease [Archaeoglobaceae archaeon]
MFRYLDHTADIAFEVWGKSFEELIENASYAFYNAFVHLDKIKEKEKKEIEVHGEEIDIVLYRWLNELLFLFDTEFFAAKNVKVYAENLKVRGELIGSRFTRELVRVEPKAITMHKFRVEKRDDEYYAFIVVDI